MSEFPTRKTGRESKYNTDVIEDFELRLACFGDDLNLEVVENSNTKESDYDSAVEQSSDQMDSFDRYLYGLAAESENKETSPQHTEGTFKWEHQLRELFYTSLVGKGFPISAVHSVIRAELKPSLDRIQEYTDQYKAINNTLNDRKSDDPFEALRASHHEYKSREDLVKELTEVKRQRQRHRASLLRLMREISDNPADFGLHADKETKPKTRLGVLEFKKRLTEIPYTQVFTVEGKRLPFDEKSRWCKNVLDTVYKGAEKSNARELLMEHGVQPVVDEMRSVSRNDLYKTWEKQDKYDELDAKLAQFMHTILSEEGLSLYGQIIYEGTVPENISKEEMPVDMPRSLLRLPVKIQQENAKKDDVEEQQQRELAFGIERVQKYSEAKLDRLTELYRQGKVSHAELLSDQLGDKPDWLILAEIRVIIEKVITEEGGVYDDTDFADMYAKTLKYHFDERATLNLKKNELMEALTSGQDNARAELRGVERHLRQHDEYLVGHIGDFISTNKDKRDLQQFMVSGASNGQLRLFNPGIKGIKTPDSDMVDDSIFNNIEEIIQSKLTSLTQSIEGDWDTFLNEHKDVSAAYMIFTEKTQELKDGMFAEDKPDISAMIDELELARLSCIDVINNTKA